MRKGVIRALLVIMTLASIGALCYVQAHAADTTAGVNSVLRSYLVAFQEAAVEEEAETETEEVTVDEADVDLLGRLIYAEASTLGEKGMQYAGSVVLNRVKSDKFPDSVQSVVFQEGQYACVRNGSINNEPSGLALEIAEELLIYGPVLPEYVVYQAEFIQGSGVYTTLGNTYYCY